MTGHLLGAAGGIEAIAVVKMLQEQYSIHKLYNSDPECDLDYVPNVGSKADIEFALSNSFGFGGQMLLLF